MDGLLKTHYQVHQRGQVEHHSRLRIVYGQVISATRATTSVFDRWATWSTCFSWEFVNKESEQYPFLLQESWHYPRGNFSKNGTTREKSLAASGILQSWQGVLGVERDKKILHDWFRHVQVQNALTRPGFRIPQKAEVKLLIWSRLIGVWNYHYGGY